MNINISTNISKEYKNIEVIINAPEKTNEVEILERELLLKSKRTIDNVIGYKDNSIYIININDIIEIYGEDKNVFCRTSNETYSLRERLYYLEEKLPPKQFLRISNSTIININQVKCFDVSIIGKIIVKFKDGKKAFVSRRKTSEIMNFLKERGK